MNTGMTIALIIVVMFNLASGAYCLSAAIKLKDMKEAQENVKSVEVKVEKKWDGYFYKKQQAYFLGEKDVLQYSLSKTECDVIDRHDGKVKVRSRVTIGTRGLLPVFESVEHWIDEKEYHPYHDLKELSGIVNEKLLGKKKEVKKK